MATQKDVLDYVNSKKSHMLRVTFSSLIQRDDQTREMLEINVRKQVAPIYSPDLSVAEIHALAQSIAKKEQSSWKGKMLRIAHDYLLNSIFYQIAKVDLNEISESEYLDIGDSIFLASLYVYLE